MACTKLLLISELFMEPYSSLKFLTIRIPNSAISTMENLFKLCGLVLQPSTSVLLLNPPLRGLGTNECHIHLPCRIMAGVLTPQPGYGHLQNEYERDF